MVQKANRKRVQSHAPDRIPEKANSDHELRKIFTTDAFILAFLTILAYIFHYFFEFGYLSFFDIPTAFISFNLPEMIPAILVLVVAYLIFVFVLLPFINDLWAVLPVFLKMSLAFLPWLIILIFLNFSWEIILLVSICALLVFGFNRYAHHRARETAGKVPHPDSRDLKINGKENVPVDPKTPLNSTTWIPVPTGNRFLWLFIFFTALVSSFVFGRMAAVTRTSFLVLDSPPCAVVYTTADRFICKPFNNNEFEKTFKIIHIPADPEIEFREVDTGPLSPK